MTELARFARSLITTSPVPTSSTCGPVLTYSIVVLFIHTCFTSGPVLTYSACGPVLTYSTSGPVHSYVPY